MWFCHLHSVCWEFPHILPAAHVKWHTRHVPIELEMLKLQILRSLRKGHRRGLAHVLWDMRSTISFILPNAWDQAHSRAMEMWTLLQMSIVWDSWVLQWERHQVRSQYSKQRLFAFQEFQSLLWMRPKWIQEAVLSRLPWENYSWAESAPWDAEMPLLWKLFSCGMFKSYFESA